MKNNAKFIFAFMFSLSVGESWAAVQPVADLVQNLQQAWMPNHTAFPNPSGSSATVSSQGLMDLSNPFFQNLGGNGRRCVSCHLPNSGWTITPEFTRAVFDFTLGGAIEDGAGLGALFRSNDGANSPKADVSTLAARRLAYSQLLNKGLIRVGIGMPSNANFKLIAVDDPYGYASAAELSLFRRPLPAANLQFLSTVMWDGRETFAGSDHCNLSAEGGQCFASIQADLSDQSNSAVTGHAEGPVLSDAEREAIVTFEASLTNAQISDNRAGLFNAAGAQGGVDFTASQLSFYGVNDNLGDYQTHAAFNRNVFNLYNTWIGATNPARSAVARGQKIFNTRRIAIRGVGGLNGAAGSLFSPALPDTIIGSCSTCHDAPNAGSHSTHLMLDIGLTAPVRRTPDMPLYTFQRNGTSQTIQTTDPGRALITGKFSDIGKFKVPTLRALAARAPYFHDGSAKDLNAVIGFYDKRFALNLTPQERSDLAAFLLSL